MLKLILFTWGLAVALTPLADAAVDASKLTLTMRTRDPETNRVILAAKTIDADKIGIVIVDPWNYHWCMTACRRVSAMAPRWNRALECARKLGMPVLWAPTDAASQYAGTVQRERAAAVPAEPAPKVRDAPAVKFTAEVGPCMCGPGIACETHYGWDGICPDLVVADTDYIVSGTDETWSICKQKALSHIIYLGLHTNMCLYGKPEGLKTMYAAGMECIVARDINDAFTHYDPPYTPDDGTEQIDDDLERAGVPTINIVDQMRQTGLWNSQWIVDPVRITPWGVEERPYLFEESAAIALTCPWLEDVEIRYTLDGSEPTADANLYEKPFALADSAKLKAAAFREGKKVSLVGEGYFVRLPPSPPRPDIYLDQVEPVRENYSAWFSSWHPVLNKSFEGKELMIRGRTYEKGIGMRAPSNIRYRIEPQYARFVALAGVDGNLLNAKSDQYGDFSEDVKKGGRGGLLAKQPAVRFRIFIDGCLVAESPMLRIGHQPWRFDVPIPEGSRIINLTVVDDGRHNVLNLADWVDAGFCTKSLSE